MIVVCSLSDFKNVSESIKPSHAISVIDPGYEPNTPNGIKKHLKLGFDDIISINDDGPLYRLPGDINPKKQTLFTESNANTVASFLKTWNEDSSIVIHCWCGVSRSMATATYLMCSLDCSNIDRNIRYIRSIAPHANPNKLMLSFYEKILNTKGKISATFDKYPYSTTYDCEYNFAPVTIFDINDMKEFK
tara:strand:- start:197 stop:766 length:570 start_codon:yes stop_codon:yes gene_type:complete